MQHAETVQACSTGETAADELLVARAESTPGIRVRRIARRMIPWVGFCSLSALFLRPVLIAPIIGDDFLNPWAQFTVARMSPIEIWQFAIDGMSNAGHFNLLGQLFGGFLNALWIWMMSDLGIRYTAMYAVFKLIVYVVTVVAIASYARAAADIAGRRMSPWRSRIYVAIPLFGILQIHVPWSHDPVANYPTSGFLAAAIGFMVMKLSLDAFRSLDIRKSVVAGIVAMAAILYYEILIASVVALFPLSIWAWRHHGGGRAGARKMLIPAACTMVIPAIVTAVLYLNARGQSVNYTGTAVDVGSGTAETFRISVLGTLPAGAWDLSREFLGPIPLRGYATGVLLIVATVLFSLSARSPERTSVERTPGSRLALVAICTAPAVFWIGATIIQASTLKIQSEITRIGQVYNFYAIGTAAIAALLVFLVLFWPRQLNVHIVRIGALAFAIGFISVQYMINWNISDRFQGNALYNRQLQAAFSDQPPMAERCQVLTTWESVDWPEYLEVGIIDGYQSSYEYFHGEPFCEGFTRSG